MARFIRTIAFLRSIYALEHWWAEFWSGLVLVLWSIADFCSASPISILPRYTVLMEIAPHWAWQVLAMFLGIQQIAALLIDSPFARLMAAGAATWFFVIISLSVTYSSQGLPPAGVVLILGWAGLNIFATAREARRVLG